MSDELNAFLDYFDLDRLQRWFWSVKLVGAGLGTWRQIRATFRRRAKARADQPEHDGGERQQRERPDQAAHAFPGTTEGRPEGRPLHVAPAVGREDGHPLERGRT